MELKSLTKVKDIVGVIGKYKIDFGNKKTVESLNIKNIEKALIMVKLPNNIINKDISDLTDQEKWKLDLARKLHDDVIIVGNLSLSLNKKEITYMKKLLLKLKNDYHKKIVIIDNKVDVFFDLVTHIFVIKNNNILYSTDNFFDNTLYKFVKMPDIIRFIKIVNKDKNILKENTDIYELIKDIYRSVA